MALDVVIACAGGSGLKVFQILEDQAATGDDTYHLIGFIDDNPDLWGTEFFGLPVFGDVSSLEEMTKSQRLGVVCPIGDPLNREKKITQLKELNVEFINAIHPSAQIARSAQVGIGNVFSQNVVIQAGAHIGDFNTFNIAAIMGPLAIIHDYCTINATVMLASGSETMNYCYIGMGAKVMQRIKVNEGTILGANGFLHKEAPAWSTVVGLPGKVIKVRKNH